MKIIRNVVFLEVENDKSYLISWKREQHPSRGLGEGK